MLPHFLLDLRGNLDDVVSRVIEVSVRLSNNDKFRANEGGLKKSKMFMDKHEGKDTRTVQHLVM